MGRPPGHPQRTHGKPAGVVQFWYFFFPRGGGSCLVLETTSLDLGDIPTGFVLGGATREVKKEKCFTWYHGRCEKMSKNRAKKNWNNSLFFCQRKVNVILWSENKSLKKVVSVYN